MERHVSLGARMFEKWHMIGFPKAPQDIDYRYVQFMPLVILLSCDTNNTMRDCKIAEMPDNDKLSMASSISTVSNILGVTKKCEMNTSEELLTNSFSDSESGLKTKKTQDFPYLQEYFSPKETTYQQIKLYLFIHSFFIPGSTKSLKSPEPEHQGHGAGASDTNVGTGSLTLEQFTEIVLAQEKMEVTDDKRTEVTINNRNTAGVFGGFQRPQGATKMKTVVLTPRHAASNVPSAAPRLSPVQKKSSRGPLSGFQDHRVRDQMRKQLETVIRKNEEILEQSHVTHVTRGRGRESTRSLDSARAKVAMPLNLSVRKDLMVSSQPESDKVNVALEKLIARHGRELEITRKTKRDKLMSLPAREPPPDVDLTPVSPLHHSSLTKMLHVSKLSPRLDTLPALIPITASEPSGPSLKRPATVTNNNTLEAKKKKQEFTTEEEPTDLSVLKTPENKDTVQKIMMDCKLALQEDMSGNL